MANGLLDNPMKGGGKIEDFNQRKSIKSHRFQTY